MIISRAPLRLSLGGGGTDLPFYATRFGGDLVSVCLNKFIYIIVQERDFYDHFLIRYSKIETPHSVAEIEHSRIKAALEFLNISTPLEITALADVPAQTGLGGSSTFLVALLQALHTYKRESVSSQTLAEEAFYIESELLQESLGKQDQYLAAFGGLLHLDINTDLQVQPSWLPVSTTTLKKLEYNTFLFSTGITHHAAEVLDAQKQEAESQASKMEAMHQIKAIGSEIKHALLTGNLTHFGHMLNTHWEFKKSLSPKMSATKIDNAYQLALESGALGGKLVGAGGGGFLLFYSETNHDTLRQTMHQHGLKELEFRFESTGCKILFEGH